METAFKANSEWNSDARVATQINTTSWNIEIAIPRKMLERPPQVNLENSPDLKNIWLFNIHRKARLAARDIETPHIYHAEGVQLLVTDLL